MGTHAEKYACMHRQLAGVVVSLMTVAKDLRKKDATIMVVR
jgi:hypothetical protein